MTKYIHYCWFGDKPLPKLAKKCIKSWKKFLPDYEIIKWSEENIDLNECPFLKEAYEQKKWAFVADYARTKAMYEMGGIYFDTDMEVIQPIDDLLKHNAFLGVEDSGKVACGVWYEKNSKSYLATNLMDFYRTQKGFNEDDIYNYSIPNLITNELNKIGFNEFNNVEQTLKGDIKIYTRDYFYPLSYNHQNNEWSENTCMIHYYDASWVPSGEKKTIKMIRLFGEKGAYRIINFKSFIKKWLKRIIKLLVFPIYKYVVNKRNKEFFKNRIENFKKEINDFDNISYLAICNKDWLGTSFATKENFENVLEFHELYNGDNIAEYAKVLCSKKLRLIVFSAFSIGWEQLIEEIRKIDKKVKIKVLWHGSNAMHCEDYDWAMFYLILKMLKQGQINSIGFAKKSMYEYYKKMGYSVEFVMNNISLSDELKKVSNLKKNSDNVKIGLYASGNRWVKNFYNQFAGAALVENSIIDCIPINQRVREFSNILNARLTGSSKNIKRNELLERMAQNDINIYCTFVECAPLLPLESMEMGVPCITGNNHHYWEGTELEKYLVVDKVDNSFEIYNRINYCLKNKNKIMKLYKEWKNEYNKTYKKNIESFLK